jgi:hypothetical protein
VLASRAKTRNYDIAQLRKSLELLARHDKKFSGKLPDNRIRRLYCKENLESILKLRQAIQELDASVRDFFMLALIDTNDRVANVVKQGRSLRKMKRGILPVEKFFMQKCERMIADLEHNPEFQRGIEPIVQEADARNAKFEKGIYGSIVTSPPYLNKIEYTKVYKLELGLFFRAQETRLRAFVGDEVAGIGKENEPAIIGAYFSDMEKALRNMFYALKVGGKAVIVVAGGCFPDRAVQSDERLIEIAERIGFAKKDCIVARQINCFGIKQNKVRESIIVLEKPASAEGSEEK